ncbi:MAG: hypothetical protein QOG35_735 [Solirubrobacteraceae bacterium]|nr:hypothetical protein [Solirubrobacteraceae bacterium]
MRTQYRFVAVLATLALAVGGTSAFAHGGGGGHGHGGGSDDNKGSGKSGDDNGRHGGQIIKSDLFGSQPDGPVLFTVAPGGKPWVINRGEARVKRNGRIKVKVRGLVIPADASTNTPAGNPLPALAATLFCNGQAVGTTAPVAFSPTGDARIDQRLDLTSLQGKPCLVPAVLINPAPAATAGGTPTADTTHYIAATGE